MEGDTQQLAAHMPFGAPRPLCRGPSQFLVICACDRLASTLWSAGQVSPWAPTTKATRHNCLQGERLGWQALGEPGGRRGEGEPGHPCRAPCLVPECGRQGSPGHRQPWKGPAAQLALHMFVVGDESQRLDVLLKVAVCLHRSHVLFLSHHTASPQQALRTGLGGHRAEDRVCWPESPHLLSHQSSPLTSSKNYRPPRSAHPWSPSSQTASKSRQHHLGFRRAASSQC